MALFDFITGIKDKLPQYGNIAAELQAPQAVSGGGELAVQPLRPTLFNRITGLGDKIYDGLFGKIVDNSGVNDGTLSATVNNPHREGGIFADLQSGFNENLNNRFQPQNLVGNGGSLARRIGEGFGTAMRFADSPLGRGLLVGGAIGALGGTPAEMAAYGLGTTALNQGNRMADKVYRDDLIKTAQQALQNSPEFNSLSADEIATIRQSVEMGADYKNATPEQQQVMLQNAAAEYLRGRQAEQLQNIVNQVGSMRGYVKPEVYRNVLASQQMRDNANYRNLMMALQAENNRAMRDLRQDQLAFQKSKEDFDRQIALGNLGIAQSKLGLEGARLRAYIQSLQNKANKTVEDKATIRQLNDNNATIADIDAGLQLIEQNPGAYSPIKGITPSWLLNYTDKKGISTRTQIDNITAVYRKWLTGAQMSDAERKAYERFLPAPTDNATAVKAKLQGMKNSIERKNKVLLQGVNVENNSGLNVDVDAVDAELKRRGL